MGNVDLDTTSEELPTPEEVIASRKRLAEAERTYDERRASLLELFSSPKKNQFPMVEINEEEEAAARAKATAEARAWAKANAEAAAASMELELARLALKAANEKPKKPRAEQPQPGFMRGTALHSQREADTIASRLARESTTVASGF
jgi:hypothetical protein